MQKILIRKANNQDLRAISALTRTNEKVMLFRSLKALRELYRNYFVAVGNGERVVGCCGFKIWPGGDAEVISLAVEKRSRGGSLGDKLLRRTIREARRRKTAKKVIAFTNPSALPLFRKNGFVPAGAQLFHEKILVDCRKCPRNRLDKKNRYLCNEVAVVLAGK